MRTLFVTFLMTGAIGVASALATETKEFEAKSIREVEVDNTAGRIEILGSDDAKATVTADKIKFDDGCQLEMVQSGPKIKIEVKRKLLKSGSQCEVNFSMQMPRAIKIDVENGAGNLTVKNTKGEIEYDLGSGHVSIDAEVLKLEGESGSGTTTVQGLVAGAELESGSGNMTLTYPKAPSKGDLKIKLGSGNAVVNVPADTRLRMDSKTGAGTATNELGDDRNAPFRVSFESGAGGLKIRKVQ